MPKLRSRVGMVFQHFELFPHLKIIDNLCLAQEKVLGRAHDKSLAKGMQLLERVGLKEQAQKFRRSSPAASSSASPLHARLAMDPIVMLFDEPTSALDPRDGQRGARRHGRSRP